MNVNQQNKEDNNETVRAREIRFALLSHDVRSALGGIVGGVSLIDGSTLSKQDQAHLVSAQSAGRMLADLLEDSNRLDQPDVNEPLDIIPLLDELTLRWKNECQVKGVEFSINSNRSLPEIIGLNATSFLRIFNNLIGNALKSTEAGQITVQIETGLSGQLSLAVTDSGIGFSAQALKNLFSFGGAQGAAITPTSGLGLHIVKMLIDRADGKLSVKNAGVGGARVEIILNTAKPTAQEKSNLASGLPDLSHLYILIAEDNVTNQLVVTQMLKAMNARFRMASDGVEALEFFDQEEFDLCLLDIEMPRKSGLEVMRAIRARSDGRETTPLIALTAYAMDEHRERITNAGADGLIPKPITDIAKLGLDVLGYLGKDAVPLANPESDLFEGVVIQRDIYDSLANVIGKDSMRELLGKVKDDLENVSIGLEKGISNADTDPIRANTHILISVAGAIGAVDLQETAQRLNQVAGQGDWPNIIAEAKNCMNGLNAVQNFVTSELNIW